MKSFSIGVDRRLEPALSTPRYLREIDACTGLPQGVRVMPMLFWLPMIFMSAMFELSVPQKHIRLSAD